MPNDQISSVGLALIGYFDTAARAISGAEYVGVPLQAFYEKNKTLICNSL